MKCPHCKNPTEKTKVAVTLDYGTEVERKRLCPICREYFTTMETVVPRGLAGTGATDE